jgi:hypothetical protein
VVEKGDVGAIMLEIETLSAKSTAMQMDCRNRAIDFFSDSDRFHDYVKLYHELIAA